jgi:hypothetical protein
VVVTITEIKKGQPLRRNRNRLKQTTAHKGCNEKKYLRTKRQQCFIKLYTKGFPNNNVTMLTISRKCGRVKARTMMTYITIISFLAQVVVEGRKGDDTRLTSGLLRKTSGLLRITSGLCGRGLTLSCPL